VRDSANEPILYISTKVVDISVRLSVEKGKLSNFNGRVKGAKSHARK
jgi:hypothetical protein